jgi:hypothetical protein
MLNYNKIDSIINLNRTPKTAIAEYLGIPESTLRNRLERRNLTPDDVEKIADFFKKPIAYFFDREGPESGIIEKPTPPINAPCDNPQCREEIALLQSRINELLEDKHLLKEYIKELQEKGGRFPPGKEFKGGLEEQRNAG